MKKFNHKYKTADGNDRAFVRLRGLETLWFNTGTLCNLTCVNCYIESSPTNDSLVYLTTEDVGAFIDEIKRDGLTVKQFGFTGGEPFMNPAMMDILTNTLEAGFDALILTNAMQPLLRPKVQAGLVALQKKFGAEKIIMRVSLDSYETARHDEERGAGAFDKTLEGLRWLSDQGFVIHIAGRKWQHDLGAIEQNYHHLLAQHKIKIAATPDALSFFTEMDGDENLPEITTGCWKTLSVDPDSIMCATSRMVVKHKGAQRPSVAACTLLPYDAQFNLGESLKAASQPVYLNHRHCAKFCVLGGSSCG